jgi:hypothetical protein
LLNRIMRLSQGSGTISRVSMTNIRVELTAHEKQSQA